MDALTIVNKTLAQHFPQSPAQPGEIAAIVASIETAEHYGFGNLIAWLQTAWAVRLREGGIPEPGCLDRPSRNTPYPLPKS
jgi:hypothetical protein